MVVVRQGGKSRNEKEPRLSLSNRLWRLSHGHMSRWKYCPNTCQHHLWAKHPRYCSGQVSLIEDRQQGVLNATRCRLTSVHYITRDFPGNYLPLRVNPRYFRAARQLGLAHSEGYNRHPPNAPTRILSLHA